MKGLFLAGRIAFGGFFIYSGINHFVKRKEIAQYAGAKHVPLPEASVVASGVLLLLGGTLIALGVKPKVGAAAIVTFLAAVSPAIHDFWAIEDPQQEMQAMVNFSKNMALLASAVALMGVEEPWPLSIAAEQPSRMEKVVGMVKRLAA
jgi:putative oxidoreductase